MSSKTPPIKPSEFKGSYSEYGLYLHNWYRKRHGAPPLKLAKWMNDSGDNYCSKLARQGGVLIHSSGLGYGENLWGGPQAAAYIKHEWPKSSGDYMHKCAVREAVIAWYNEVKHYNYNHGGFSMATGHFTAMVWKASTELGIGVCWLGGTIIVAGCYKVFPNMQGHFTANVLRYRDVVDDEPAEKPASKPAPATPTESNVKVTPTSKASCKYEWVAAQNGGTLPTNMVLGGKDGEHNIYVSRSNHENGIIPGKLIVGYGTFLPYGGKEHGKGTYEVLTGEVDTFAWEPLTGTIPAKAIVGGNSPSGDTYYIGRAVVQNANAVGKIHAGCCFVSYGGKEYGFDENFDILVLAGGKATVKPDAVESIATKIETDLQLTPKPVEARNEGDGGGDQDKNATVVQDSSPELQKTFAEAADKDGTIGWYELKDLLTSTNDIGDKVAWDKVLCRMLIKTATPRDDERIPFLSYENIITGLTNLCKDFVKVDKDGSGFLDPFEVRDAFSGNREISFAEVEGLIKVVGGENGKMNLYAFILAELLLFTLSTSDAGIPEEDHAGQIEWMGKQIAFLKSGKPLADLK